MKKRYHNTVNSNSYDEEDIETSSSIVGQALSSVRGALSAMSDGSTADGDQPSSLVQFGDNSLTQAHRRRIVTTLRASSGVGGVAGDSVNLENSTAMGDDDDENSGKSSRSTVRIIVRWWSGVVSRVSRSASSLLSQHSPNLNDILDGEVPMEQPPTRGVSVPESVPEDDPRGAPISIDDDNNEQEVFALREEVALLKKKIQELQDEKDKQNSARGKEVMQEPQINGDVQHAPADSNNNNNMNGIIIPSITTPIQMLQPDQISRYSRQLLLTDGFGVTGQKQLLSTSILVIGAGGIGSTVLLYLAATGVGHITIVDYDCVEMSNLHRQVIHRDADASKNYDQVGMNKAQSAKQAMLDLNPTISCTALAVMITADNALELVMQHDVVVDACDNPRTRYLLNDACILAGKPLVSGSAMGTEGQLTVYNYQPTTTSKQDQQKKQTACYRCLYPNPVPAEGSKSCSDNGVLGMVPGAIGVLQAVEAIKLITGIGNIMHDRLLMYDSLHCSFMNIKKPPARPKCSVCSPDATIKTMKDSEKSLQNVRGPSDCNMSTHANLSEEQHISCINYNELRKNGQPHVLLDVRVERQYEICSLEGSINLPLEQLQSKLDMVAELSDGKLPVYCLCRRGVASAEATAIIQKFIEDGNGNGSNSKIHSVYNIVGGLNSWVKTVDSDFPQY